MDTHKPSIPHVSDEILLTDEAYYKYVFKKTEKIVGVVFYILGQSDIRHAQSVRDALERAAQAAHAAVLATLVRSQSAASRELRTLIGELAALESTVRVAQSAGILEPNAADVLSLEIAGTQRSVRRYLVEDKRRVPSLLEEHAPAGGAPEKALPAISASGAPRSARRARSAAPSATQQDPRTDRRRRIKDILASQGQATIKDISDKMNDCSEKTIQRELVAMVQAGEVLKEGERRWSTYALAPGV